MYIKKIELKDFRNYPSLSLELDEHTNMIYGDNAQGKTNILEAVYVGATTRSHRQSRDRDIIRFGAEESHIRIAAVKKGIDYRIDMHLRKNRTKAIAINGVPIKRAAELLGILNLVFFSPEDLSIIKSGPSERRRFIDMELCQIDGFYMNELSEYNRTVNQRNRLLREMRDISDMDMMLDIYDEQLSIRGSNIIKRRISFIDELEKMIREIHLKISGQKEECRVDYRPDVSPDGIMDELRRYRIRDKKQKTTTVGPHRDDIIIRINEKDVRKYGSQGQQRSAALSLKLSEIELIRRAVKDEPILLLDDVLSELDSKRQAFLLENIENIQTLITCTGLDDLVNSRLDINRTYRVVNGAIEDAEQL